MMSNRPAKGVEPGVVPAQKMVQKRSHGGIPQAVSVSSSGSSGP